MGHAPTLRATFFARAAIIGPRRAGRELGLTPGQASGLWHRHLHPARPAQPRDPATNTGPHAWDESRLTEPWVEYRARRQAERASRHA